MRSYFLTFCPKVKFIILATMMIVLLSRCSSHSMVGKYYTPKGGTPCPAMTTLESYAKAIQAAQASDNEKTIAMLLSGEMLNLDNTKSYKIISQGKKPYEWYMISSDGGYYYVSPIMGNVN